MNKFLDTLVAEKKINLAQAGEIETAALRENVSVEETIIKKGIMDMEDVAKYQAESFSLPYHSLIGKKIEETVLDTIPYEVAENYKLVCFDRTEEKMSVGLFNPENFKAIEAIDFLAKEKGLKVEYYFISPVSYEQAIKQYTTLNKEVTTALERKALDQQIKEEKEDKEEKKEDFEEVVKSAPVAKIVSVIIRHAVEGRASDIHIEPMPKESRVRYRIDGILHTSLTMPKDIHSAVIARIKVLSDLKLDETRRPQDGRIRESINGKEIDFRVSIIPLSNDEEKVVMRILDVTKGAPDLEELGYYGTSLEIIKKNIQKSDGMLLITGPTGSGKSTTLFSILNDLNNEDVNISTLEDPVEYQIKGVNQSQVKQEVGFSFAAGLRSLLRQDPDIIMVGEIRDNETAELAIHASLTGHFVLSTLHTNDAIGALPRLLDMKVEPFLLGSTLNLVIAQRLARRICKFCKEETSLPKEVMDEMKSIYEELPEEVKKKQYSEFKKTGLVFYKGRGCPRCGNTGYSGRVAIAEVLDVNLKIKDLIFHSVKNLTIKDVRETQPFITMKEDGALKALFGWTTVEEVMRVAQD